MRLQSEKDALLDASEDDAVVFTVRVALALQRYGLPSHRLEEAMDLLDRSLGLHSHFYSSPTAIMATFGLDRNQHTYIFRGPPNELNLEKLDLTFALARDVAAGHLNPTQGISRLEETVSAPNRYGTLLTVFCFLASSAGAARLFGGGWREVLVSSAIGLGVSLLIVLAGRFPPLGRILIPLASIGAIALAKASTLFLGPFDISIATVTGLIVMIPGLTLTTAVTELAQGNAVSGTSRFAMATITFLMMAFGIALGGQIEHILPQAVVIGDSVPLPEWTGIAAQVLVPMTFVVIFRARPKDAILVFLAGTIAFQASGIGSARLGPELGTFVAAFVLALFANGFARISRRPSSIALVPGIMLLVPGSIGFSSLQFLLSNQTVPGLEDAVKMMFVATALVAGLIFAGILLPPKSPIPPVVTSS